MRLCQSVSIIILCLSAGACYAQTQDSHPPFPICGGVLCEECIPLERQTAPGIGLDLSLSHGTAAIAFQNGTTYDILLLEGSFIYQAAMKDLALEAKLLFVGHEGKLPAIGPSWEPEIPTQPVMQKLLPNALFKALRHLICPKVADIVPSRDQWVNALAGMLQALKTQVENTHGTQNTEIWLSVPDFAWHVEPVMQRLQEAATQVGLHIHRYRLQGLGAMKELHGIDHCWDDDCSRQDHLWDAGVLVVDRSNHTLGLSLYTRPQGMLETETTQQEYHFGLCAHNERTHSGHEPKFEQKLRNFLASTDQPVDRVVLIGSGATDPMFLSALRTVFGAISGLDEQSYLRDAQSHTFASARQGAKQSRLINMGAFLRCDMPERCFHGKDGALRMMISEKLNKELYEKKSEL
jgi:hypothetical protein